MHPWGDPALHSYAVALLFSSGHIIMYAEINIGCKGAPSMDEYGCAVYINPLLTKEASDL